MRAVLPSAWRTFSIEMERSPTALLNMHQTCSVWCSTGTRTTRFVCHTFHKIGTRHNSDPDPIYRFVTFSPPQTSGHSDFYMDWCCWKTSSVNWITLFLFFCKIWTSGETMWPDIRRINNITAICCPLCHRVCTPLWSVRDWWWLIWLTASFPPFSGLSLCPLCIWWVVATWLHVEYLRVLWPTCVLSLQIRVFTNTFTLTPYNGAEALVHYQDHLFLKVTDCT